MNDDFLNIVEAGRLTEVVDIGANPIDGDPPYKNFLLKGMCNVTGFEPQLDALNELNKRKGSNERYLSYAVGDGKVHDLHICAASGMTSLFAPDWKTLESFQFLKQAAEVKKTCSVQTVRLDDVSEIDVMDYLKIDIQGGELSVFQNAKNKLKNTVVIQTEVSFINLYKGQPNFGEIDCELRKQGFVPHAFAAIKRWPVSPCIINNDPRLPLNQLLEADVVYIKDFTKLELLDAEQLKQLAVVSHCVYKSYDIALKCLVELEQRKEISGGVEEKYFSIF